ncbi:MAG: Eco47II family restriction endonuclease, partial [Bacteroidales bacterium]
SIDRFYALVTGQEDAFHQICMALPTVIQEAVDTLGDALVPNDTVMDELKAIAAEKQLESDDLAIAMAVYLLGFGSYKGF